jgi:hypothetical protein
MIPSDFSPLMVEVQQWMLQMSEQQRMQKLMGWSEEQPHLFGFLVNLADDFPSPEHQALSLLPLVVQESFRRMGMSVDTVAPDLLQKCIEEQVDNAEKNEQAEEESARMLQELQRIWEFFSDLDAGQMDDREDVALILRILLSAFERSVPEQLQ